MKLNKKSIAMSALALTAVASGIVATTSQTFAHGRMEQDGLAEAFAQRFNLNVDEVQSFFQEHHQDMMQERQDAFLDKAVADGTLTEEQKALVQQKLEELKASFDESLSPEEMREKMQAQHDELKQWAEEQGIDLRLLMPNRPKMGHGMRSFNRSFEPAQ